MSLATAESIDVHAHAVLDATMGAAGQHADVGATRGVKPVDDVIGGLQQPEHVAAA